MTVISYDRHRFPACIIRHSVWLYLRFTLSLRDVEDLLAERGMDVSYETIRRWVEKFGPAGAQDAALQVAWIGATLSQHARRGPQHLQRSTPPYLQIDAANL